MEKGCKNLERKFSDIEKQLPGLFVLVDTFAEDDKEVLPFKLTFQENTDISDAAQLVVLSREVNKSFQVTEKMLNLRSLKDAVENCLCKNNLCLEILFGISTDEAPEMIDKVKGAVKLLIDKIESKNKTNNCCPRDYLNTIHCF
ncbi:general transcription factor II-I repeat domain-containing protein 2 [Trichonephila clavata]|uniref:General transcription factor II-I repeat domain-containing protein 2 n=1 Tax=Trichonephila clavata TaxID=2740835 RepID=A0A8X6J5D8_TRICU|nr:general transcription factor II-I repeat domain-containing protein 2 [Trichonephila clavata]